MKIEPVTLAGSHVRLEPLATAHLDALCDAGLDPELWRWTPSVVRDADDMRAYIETALADCAAGRSLPFVQIDVASGRVVGSTRFLNIDVSNRRVEIGATWLGAPWQRTPINTEAKLLLLCHAFETWRCNRVEFKTDALNVRSRRAILRLGAREEGVLRHHMVTWSARLRDTVYFSVIAEEWPAVKRALTASR